MILWHVFIQMLNFLCLFDFGEGINLETVKKSPFKNDGDKNNKSGYNLG